MVSISGMGTFGGIKPALWGEDKGIRHRCVMVRSGVAYVVEEPRMTDTRLSFKEMCVKFEVTPRTLRYYEYIELLAPEKEGRARFYGPREVARMKLILRGRRFGFSLEEIRQWLLIYGKKGERPQLEAWLLLADRQLAALEAQRAELDQSLADLRALRETAVEEMERLPKS
jgi:DNA-binding transcriptional MerR regulator